MKKLQNPYEEKINQFSTKLSQRNKKKPQEEKKNPHKITINVSECQYPVVRLVAKKLKWNISNQPISNFNFDLCWIDGHCRQEIFARMQPYQKINHFPGMEILSRKNFLGKSLMEFKKCFPEEYDFFPITWTLPAEYNDLKEYNDKRRQGKAQTFICKPEASCQGRGIFLTRNIEKLKYQRCVVQRYMSRPFLIDGLKFDLRIYVLIAGTDPLRIFVYNEGLARFCTEPYEQPKSDNLDNKFMHLTNYAINKLSPNFIFNEEAKQCDKGHKRSLSSIYKSLESLGHNSQETKERIYDIIIKTIITGYPNLTRFQQGSHPQNFANDMCFEILGFDVILNHKLQPQILQVNYTPSFSTDTPFDKAVKKNLIYDALKLLNINEKWKKQSRRKRQVQIKQRMLSGKRTKYTPEQKQQLFQKYSKIRNEFESQNLGGWTKIFCKSQEQMLKYAHFYEFAQTLYQKQNRITGVATSKSYMPFYMPYAKSPKNQFQNQFSRTGAFSSAKIINRKVNQNDFAKGSRSIENKKIFSSVKYGPSQTTIKNQYNSIKTGNLVKQSSCRQKISISHSLQEIQINDICTRKSNGVKAQFSLKKGEKKLSLQVNGQSENFEIYKNEQSEDSQNQQKKQRSFQKKEISFQKNLQIKSQDIKITNL